MPYAIATDRPAFFAVTKGADTLATGQQPPNSITFTGDDKAILSDASENVFLSKMAGKAGSYKPLPDSGWLEAGSIYGYGGGLVIVRQAHSRTADAPADVPALFTVYRAGGPDVLEWVAGEKVETGTRRTYGGKTWAAVQGHYTQADYQPDKTPALWKEVTAGGPGEWDFPVAYKVDDVVTYGSAQYRCVQGHTSQAGWTPDVVPALWAVV